MYFHYRLPLEIGEALHLNKLEYRSLMQDALCKVWLKLFSGSRKKDFETFSMYFWLYRYFFYLEKGVALHLNKLL